MIRHNMRKLFHIPLPARQLESLRPRRQRVVGPRLVPRSSGRPAAFAIVAFAEGAEYVPCAHLA